MYLEKDKKKLCDNYVTLSLLRFNFVKIQQTPEWNGHNTFRNYYLNKKL